MTNFELITAEGTSKFQLALNEWTDNNKDKKVIGISHSSLEINIPLEGSKLMKTLQFSAIIHFEDSPQN